MSEQVREVQQARASASTLATLTGKIGQIIIEKLTFRPHVMDGSTAGGHPVAMKSELLSEGPTLAEAAQEKALTALGVFSALETLITEYGGTVPTDESGS